MSTATPGRRSLQFDHLQEVLRDVDTLQRDGYQRVGNWDLAQVCGHLSEWMSFPLDGFPRTPWFIRLMLGIVRRTVGPKQLRKILDTRTFPTQGPTIRETIPQPGGDEESAVQRLRQIVERAEKHTGPIHPSPLFGSMNHEIFVRLQLIHCAHHLSFLIPGRKA